MEKKFYDQFDFKSRITPELEIIGTENKEEFKAKYLTPEVRSQFKLIGTHSDSFHCDEVLATSLLLRTAEFEKSIIVRTREQDILDQLDIQCDVGAVYDPSKNRFDHHQRSFTTHWWSEQDEQTAAENKVAEEKGEPTKEIKKPITKLSSAGLIYKHFGKQVIFNAAKEYEVTLTEAEVDLVYQKLYKGMFLEIDAIDNGVNISDNRSSLLGKLGDFLSILSWGTVIID